MKLLWNKVAVKKLYKGMQGCLKLSEEIMLKHPKVWNNLE